MILIATRQTRFSIAATTSMTTAAVLLSVLSKLSAKCNNDCN